MFVVTGGGQGLGQALAWQLAKRGKKVLIVGRHSENLENTAKHSPLISSCTADITHDAGRQRLVKTLEDLSALDGLIHNAGTIYPICSLLAIKEQEWNKQIAVNLTAPLLLTQLLFSKLTTGRVLHIGSNAANIPIAGWGAYCVSKAGLAMLSRCWLEEFPALAIASVLPGIIDTAMQELIRDSSAPMKKEMHGFFMELKQKNRLLKPETVAFFLAWLLLTVNKEDYVSKEWDIYDASHHSAWLPASHSVPPLGE